MNITIAKTIGGGLSTTISEADYNKLNNIRLKGCPFKNYTAIDLLHDLEAMYSWKVKPGIPMTIDEFMTLCHDIHAEAYRSIFVN